MLVFRDCNVPFAGTSVIVIGLNLLTLLTIFVFGTGVTVSNFHKSGKQLCFKLFRQIEHTGVQSDIRHRGTGGARGATAPLKFRQGVHQ